MEKTIRDKVAELLIAITDDVADCDIVGGRAVVVYITGDEQKWQCDGTTLQEQIAEVIANA